MVVFDDGRACDEWSTLVNPEDYFDRWNVSIHGIDEAAVVGAPTLADVFGTIRSRLSGEVAVCHTHFDRAATARAAQRLNVPPPDCRWLDSARVVRRVWREFSRSGYGLVHVCQHLGITPGRHHHALDDARAAGEILVRAMAETSRDVDTLLGDLSREPTTGCEGNEDGLFFGEEMVFTGALTMPRQDAAELAAAAGCKVTDGVRKSTTVVVVGDQDIRKLAGHDMSNKQRKAESLRAAGQSIRILGESDFLELLRRGGHPRGVTFPK